MKKSIKVVLPMVCMMLSWSALTACSSDNGAATSSPSSTSTAATNTKPGDAAQNEPVTIKVWAMGAEGDLIGKMATKFHEENPNITVETQSIPWDVAHDKILTAIASKSGPDVTQLGTTWVSEMAAAGALLDMKPELAKYPGLNTSNFYDGSVQTGMYNGQYVGIPWYIDTNVLFYRSDLLSQVGMDHAPQTWDEMKDAAVKLAKRPGGKSGFLLDPKTPFIANLFGEQNGSELIKDGKALFDSPEYVEAIKFYKSFYTDGATPKSANQGQNQIQDFKSGVSPMLIGSPWMISALKKEAPEIDGKWKTAVLPKKVTNTSQVGGSNLSIFNFTKNKEAALKFVEFMSKPNNQMEWMKLSTDLPSAKQAWEDAALKNDPLMAPFGEQLKNAKAFPMISQWNQVETKIGEYLEKIVIGNADVDASMKQMNQEINQILQKK